MLLNVERKHKKPTQFRGANNIMLHGERKVLVRAIFIRLRVQTSVRPFSSHNYNIIQDRAEKRGRKSTEIEM